MIIVNILHSEKISCLYPNFRVMIVYIPDDHSMILHQNYNVVTTYIPDTEKLIMP